MKQASNAVTVKIDVFVLSRPCLKGTIQNAETAVVKCPYTDQDYSCDMQLLDREIKSVGNHADHFNSA